MLFKNKRKKIFRLQSVEILGNVRSGENGFELIVFHVMPNKFVRKLKRIPVAEKVPVKSYAFDLPLPLNVKENFDLAAAFYPADFAQRERGGSAVIPAPLGVNLFFEFLHPGIVPGSQGKILHF
jgi:hypothetical protein